MEPLFNEPRCNKWCSLGLQVFHDLTFSCHFRKFSLFWSTTVHPGVGEVLPMMAHTGDSPQMGYIFQASRIRKGRHFTSWSIWKGAQVGKTVILVCYIKGPKGLTDEKSGKRQCIYSSLKSKGMQSYNQEIWKWLKGGTFIKRRYTKWVPCDIVPLRRQEKQGDHSSNDLTFRPWLFKL